MKPSKIRITCQAASTLSPQSVSELQGGLKTLTKENYQRLKNVIIKFGFCEPISVWSDGKITWILNGHQRIRTVLEMISEGWECPELPVNEVQAADINEARKITLALASQYGQMDSDGLYEFLNDTDVTADDMMTDYHFADLNIPEFITGYMDDEDKSESDPEKDDAVPDTADNAFNVERGQIWKLGQHRIMCGDSTSKDDVERLMDGDKADILHTDPPYNVDYSQASRPKPGKKDLGKIQNDKMDGVDFYNFLHATLHNGFEYCSENSTAYIWHASREQINFTNALINSGWSFNQQLIWKKPMLLGRSKYQWAHEPCLFGIKGSPFFTSDRTKTTVWDFGGYDKSKNVHPTQKPIVVCAEAISNSSEEGGKILDLFLGSGSTLIACEKTNRKCYGMELDEHYCSVIINRWQEFTGQTAEKIK